MAQEDGSPVDSAFAREVLAADIAVALGILTTEQAATSLGRAEDNTPGAVLGSENISPDERDRISAEVDRLVEQAGGDALMALARRGVDRALPSQMSAKTAHALSESGARLRSPLRTIADDRYMGFLPIGEGGMGVVYLALDTELNRRVAIKMVRAGAKDPVDQHSDPVPEDSAARFVQEAIVTGGLEHPGIVPVYEMGRTPAGVPYYTMRLVRGERTLDDAIREAETLGDRLNLLEP
ncbi:MAG: hypothetical protein ACYTDX_04965, partial [Planctomycetota bacterium]